MNGLFFTSIAIFSMTEDPNVKSEIIISVARTGIGGFPEPKAIDMYAHWRDQQHTRLFKLIELKRNTQEFELLKHLYDREQILFIKTGRDMWRDVPKKK